MTRLSMLRYMRPVSLLATALLPLIAGCSDFATAPTRTAAELRVTVDTAILLTGDTLQFEIELLDTDGEVYSTIPSWSPPLWTSERPERVDLSGGVVRPIRGGETPLQVELAGLTADVVVRANPSALSVNVPMLYITQSVQRQSGDVPLIAGREGLLRVVVRADDENYYRPRIRANFHQDGAVVHTVALALAAQGLPTRVIEGSMLLSYNGLIPDSVLQPGVRMVLEIDPEGIVPAVAGSVLRIPETGTLDLAVREVAPFRLMMVPVDQALNGRTSRLTPEHAEEMTVLTRNIFPLSDFRLEVRERYITQSDLSTSDGWFDLIEEIRLLRHDDGNPHYYYGGFDRPSGTNIGGLGWVGIHPVSIGMDNRPDVIAHEIGHNLGLPHAPCGGASNADPNYPYTSGLVGVFGFDRTSGRLQDPKQKYDLMSYCDPIWISDYNYEKVIQFRDTSPNDPMLPAGAGLMAGTGAVTRVETLIIRGGVRNGRLVLSPALDWQGPVALPAAGGRYTLEGLDGAGGVVFSIGVEPAPLDHSDDSHFMVALAADMAQPDRLARLRLTGPEGVVERTRSPGPASRRPDVVLRAPGAPGTVGGRAAAEWDATEFPLAVVRDRDTGRIRAMSRTGQVTIPNDADASRLDVLLSDGLRTHRARVQR